MKYISDIMTKNPVCCTPEMGVPEVAELMLRSDCGPCRKKSAGNYY
jgi:CBS domain-containing protein